MKAKNGDVKHILKQIAAPYLPESVYQRKKSPYPKNYHPEYEQILCKDMKYVLSKGNHPINDFLDPVKTLQFCNASKDYGTPWYGQLMAGPQLLAYYLQTDYWLREYHVSY
jgi:asparagine synthase (glutamine-hydrolysing)